MEKVLKTLGATPQESAQIYARLTDPRRARLIGNFEVAPNVPASLLGTLPGIGDLLRAMRQRQGWTQEQLAVTMKVNRATVIQWEATWTLPPAEEMVRLCLLLYASPEDQVALRFPSG